MKARRVVVLLCALSIPGVVAAQSCPPLNQNGTTNADVPRDDVVGSWIEFETAPIHPMDAGNGFVVAVNQPAGQVIATPIASLGPNTPPFLTWKTGPGPIAIKARPGTTELWVVDRVTNSVGIVDYVKDSLVRTIHVGAEPHAIVFAGPTNDRAYVSCSAVDRVDVIDLRPGSATEYQVVNSIAIPARNPRALCVLPSGSVAVTSFLSGNNTASTGGVGAFRIAEVTPAEGAFQSLPDRDVLKITVHPTDPTQDALSLASTLTGVGTILFNAHVRPGTTDMWIPHTDALNLTVGEKNFIAGQVVRNGIRVIGVGGAMTLIDLDTQAPTGVSTAQPTGLAFDIARNRVYVCCYGGDVVVALDLSGAWQGHIAIPSRGNWRSGPRTCVVEGDTLLVFNKNDNSITRVDISTPISGAHVAPPPGSIGFDPEPEAIKRGRGHFINGEMSGNGTSSCASCHIDGHTDATLWELSKFAEPEGTPGPIFAIDFKGPTITQTLRGLRETAPYHWRGEKRTLQTFNQAFVDLMESPTGPLPAGDFADMRTYLESLTHPANPEQDFFRDMTPAELEGADLWFNVPGVRCDACHQLPLGTGNELINTVQGGPSRSHATPQLRNSMDKLRSPPITVGGNFGRNGIVTELGTGMLHNGSIPTNFDFMDEFFALTLCQKQAIDRFMRVFDTGLAPSTGFQATVNQENAATFTAHLDLMVEADRGNCDLYVIGSFRLINQPGTFHYDGAYIPGTGTVKLQDSFFSDFPVNQIPLMAAAGVGEWTFVGTPIGTANRYGIDIDDDGLRDYDEAPAGCDPHNPDTDGDGLPDGYEVDNGLDPTVATALPTSDGTPPTMQIRTVYTITNTAKFIVTTDELARVEVTVSGVPLAGTTVSPATGGFAKTHQLIVPSLPDSQVLNFNFTATDPSQNSTVTVVSESTDNLAEPNKSLVGFMTLSVIPIGGGFDVQATAIASDRNFNLLPDHTIGGVFFLELDGVFSPVLIDDPQLTDATGTASWSMSLPASVNTATTRRLHFSVIRIDGQLSPPGTTIFRYVEALDLQSYTTITF